MENDCRGLRRHQLDRLLSSGKGSMIPETPTEGWLKALRESLGMSLQAFGDRLGITRQSAQSLERSEVSGSITLRKLKEAADALGCDVQVVFVPRQSLEAQVQAQAEEVVRERLRRVGHTMSLEAQTFDAQSMEAIVERKAREMVERGDSRIWSS